MGIYREIKSEIKELVVLIKMIERYEALIANGFMSLDKQSVTFNDQRLSRIEEILRKYDVGLFGLKAG
ncbi:hypothetical protein [Pseudomonas frederiksbergensis]|uniref:hypothetical protein n=1 Tax=Pseudomonas frederiksbergensis TaxID=104087 RepID=UPI003D1ABED7